MKKLNIEMTVLLPEIADEKDQCVKRIIRLLQGKTGIERVHIKQGEPAVLCIHYDPDLISLE